ncbi:MAG TPA: signal peptidase II [Haliangiales bacterium]|nr:signal peptidase II [Haliangiales bacterium]
MPLRYRLFVVSAVLALAADQLTKLWARGSLAFGRPVTVIKNFWEWELSYNYGSAFGFLNNAAWAPVFLTVMALGVAAFITVYVYRERPIEFHVGKRQVVWGPLHDDQKWLTVALGLIWSGALGNAIDRVLDGKVTDFVLWRIKDVYRHPQFNVADAALVAGVIILALDVGGDQKRHKKPAKKK